MDKWKKASDDGTIIHEELEKFIKSRTQPKEYKAKKGIRWLEEYLSNENIEFSKDNIFSEVIIYSEKLKISGTIDVLIKNKEDEYIYVTGFVNYPNGNKLKYIREFQAQFNNINKGK